MIQITADTIADSLQQLQSDFDRFTWYKEPSSAFFGQQMVRFSSEDRPQLSNPKLYCAVVQYSQAELLGEPKQILAHHIWHPQILRAYWENREKFVEAKERGTADKERCAEFLNRSDLLEYFKIHYDLSSDDPNDEHELGSHILSGLPPTVDAELVGAVFHEMIGSCTADTSDPRFQGARDAYPVIASPVYCEARVKAAKVDIKKLYKQDASLLMEAFEAAWVASVERSLYLVGACSDVLKAERYPSAIFYDQTYQNSDFVQAFCRHQQQDRIR
ncbi:MAG: hypothetical protein ACK5O9_04690 [Holosporales bacterium]